MSLKGAVTLGPEAPLVLTAGKNSNLHKWTKSTFLRMQEKFGRIANVMKTDKPHEIPPLEPSDYTPHGDHGLSENAIMAIQVDQTKSRMRRVRDLLEQHPQFYAALLQGVSTESYREAPRLCSQRPGSRPQRSMKDHQRNPFNEYNWRRTVVARVQQSNHACRLRQQLSLGEDIRRRVQGDLYQQLEDPRC